MPDRPTAPPLARNQRWTPAPGKRAKAREIVRLETDRQGYPSVVWSPFWPNCGHTGTSSMREDSFRTWIKRHKATCEEVVEDLL